MLNEPNCHLTVPSLHLNIRTIWEIYSKLTKKTVEQFHFMSFQCLYLFLNILHTLLLSFSTGFELAIHKLQFADQFCLFTDHSKQSLWNSQVKIFLLLQFLFSRKPQSCCLTSSLSHRLYPSFVVLRYGS